MRKEALRRMDEAPVKTSVSWHDTDVLWRYAGGISAVCNGLYLYVACLGYLLSSLVRTLEGAVIAQQIIYIGGVFLQLFIVLSIFNLCQVHVPKWLRTMMFGVCVLVYASVLTISREDWFYRNVSFDMVNEEPVLFREYGFPSSSLS